ncbi:MAG: ABC transporter ATP-binding protein, partial [Myxococcota bacterium]
MNTGLQMHDIHKRFASTDIVRGLCLEVKSGEILALLGPSGCGKTTALRMVAGLERPDSGRITIGEHTVFDRGVDRPPETRRIGMVFQSYAVWPHMRIIENVAYPLRLTKAADATDRALRALRLVRLDGMAQRTPDTLSGGQQQRVALARALVAEPDLLLFDEPLSNLDAKLREEMRHEIRQLIRTAGCTAVYVTHDQLEAFAVSDRVA